MSQLSVETIFALADREVFKLPPAVVAARERAAAVAQLAAEPETEPDHPATVAEQLVAAVIESAAGGAAPDYHQPRLNREDREAYDARLTALRLAGEQVEARLASTVRTNAEAIIKLLQPTFDGLVGRLREALNLAASLDPAAALTASAGVRSKLAARFGVRADLDSISAARRALADAGYRSQRDEAGEFALLKNVDSLYPRPSRQLSAPPWKDQDILEWAVLNGGEVWLPTVAEQDARYEQVYAEAERQHAAGARHARAIAESFVGGSPAEYTEGNAPARPQRPPVRGQAAAVAERLFGTPIPDGADGAPVQLIGADVGPDGS